MGKKEYEMYMEYKGRVENHIGTLRSIFEEMNQRSKERIWLRHQQFGDLDDTKLVDGLTGDKMIFKRRGVPPGVTVSSQQENNNSDKKKKRLQFVMDVSGSMYRFNGEDKR
jgi:hypothetical protein